MRESGGTGSLVSTSNIPPQMSKVVARKPTGAVGPSTSYAPERPRTRRGLWVVDRTPRRGRRGTARGARREPRDFHSREQEAPGYRAGPHLDAICAPVILRI